MIAVILIVLVVAAVAAVFALRRRAINDSSAARVDDGWRDALTPSA